MAICREAASGGGPMRPSPHELIRAAQKYTRYGD